jgi:hypothetical protein
VTQVSVLELQYLDDTQSLLLPQPPDGMQTSAEALHTPERQRVAFEAVHDPVPLGRPHLPSWAQVPVAQSAATAQAEPFVWAQLAVEALQTPVTQTRAFSAVQSLSWIPSSGMGWPAAMSCAQVNERPSQ